MAKYTIELREIVENGRNIFPFSYEFYDEKMRSKFERDFIRHFYFREIGCETIDRFILNLQDKMNTVFPVYNAMLKAGQIKYKVLDNYYLSETTKRMVTSEGKSRGVSSSVGQTFDDQQTNTTESASNIQNETGTSESTRNGVSETVGTSKDTKTEKVDTITSSNGTAESNTTKKGSGTSSSDQNVDKRFLDTPQGAISLNNTKYVTSMSLDIINGTTENSTTETATDQQTTTGAGTTDTKVEGETNSENNSTTNTTDTTTGETGRDFSENQESMGSVTHKGEQRTTADNNTRLMSDNKSMEETEVIHAGNIGVESDAVMIQKHLKLQQLIAKTFQLFFDECEDLFMLVY